MSKPLTHRTICYDDEGRLDCSLRCDVGEAEREAEQISRADADRLVEQNSLDVMAAVIGAMR